MIKSIIALLLIAQTFCLQLTTHLSTGSNAMYGVEQSSFIWFIVIGVVAFIIIGIIIFCLFRQNPEYRDSYIQRGGDNYYNNG